MKIHYPNSKKIYLHGERYPELRVAMRQVELTPTVTKDAEVKSITKRMHL